MKKIPLTKGKFAIVDDEDFEWLSKYTWHYLQIGYAATTLYKDKKKHNITMHRLILKFPKGKDVDHINHDTIDNRKSNLRVCSRSQNLWNMAKFDNQYKGVTFYKKLKRWRTCLHYKYKFIHVGYFTNPEDAARAYNQKAKELFGEFAYQNVIKKGST